MPSRLHCLLLQKWILDGPAASGILDAIVCFLLDLIVILNEIWIF